MYMYVYDADPIARSRRVDVIEISVTFQYSGQGGHDKFGTIGDVSEREATRSDSERDLVSVVRREAGVGNH